MVFWLGPRIGTSNWANLVSSGIHYYGERKTGTYKPETCTEVKPKIVSVEPIGWPGRKLLFAVCDQNSGLILHLDLWSWVKAPLSDNEMHYQWILYLTYPTNGKDEHWYELVWQNILHEDTMWTATQSDAKAKCNKITLPCKPKAFLFGLFTHTDALIPLLIHVEHRQKGVLWYATTSRFYLTSTSV